MATILRVAFRQHFRSINCIKRCQNTQFTVASFSTSNGRLGGHSSGPEIIGDPSKFENWKTEENWVSRGFSYTDQKADEMQWRIFMHLLAASLCWIVLVLVYKPLGLGRKKNVWARREAYLEIERRRKAGLPIIDKNFVDPSIIKLPSDDEIPADFEIII